MKLFIYQFIYLQKTYKTSKYSIANLLKKVFEICIIKI